MSKLGLGVLGLGEGRSIISAGCASPLWHVARLCDVNVELGRECCAEFDLPVERFTTDYTGLLRDPAVDVVGIYTPDHLHAEHVLQALAAGKHVVCTKPFLNDLSRAREVLEAQRRSGRRVMVGQSTRFFAPFTRQREHFVTGDFGDLITVEAAYHADHGDYPEQLTALAPAYLKTIPQDLFSGQPLHYQRGENAYLLYSVGPNMKDDRAAEKSDDIVVQIP